MNLYFWLILFISAAILIRGALRGARNGFVKEAEGLAAVIFTTITLVLISSIARGNITEHVSTKALAIALLVVLAILYSLCRIIFSSLRLFAGLPVIRHIDSILGIAGGTAKAFLLLYIIFYLLKIWLNI
ncbi:MAG: CvpA family protein [Eubacteriales bacterium]|nr:CvpA family protein [Eubacteriales bacterium]